MPPSKQVALFVTCLVDQIMPEVGVAATRLLRRAGYDVLFPPEQTCCGQPFFNSGFHDQARALARRTIDTFADCEAVVLPSGSCTTMVRAEYSHLFEDEPNYSYRARRLAGKTYELSEFLVQKAGWDPAPHEDAPHVTYHDSCHMCRVLGLGETPRQLLSGAGCHITEMAESDRCCGFGGIFSIRMPEVSNAMTAEKVAQAAETESEILVTADPGCLMQMRGLLQEAEGPDGRYVLRAEHLATVLEELTR
ncbi:MAG: (Fe-S)-binding protein [Candidatus Promineifilaceae bacterium]|nr:(Fe-S)-binding protein [Candidatus Promineifilaceae bacterium]